MTLEEAEAHRRFSAECFNRAWDLIEKPERSADEDQLMVHLAHASLWHWMQRSDCTDQNLSTGYWQLARIFTLLKDPNTARQHAQSCLDYSRRPGVPPLLLAYAFESLARVELLSGNENERLKYRDEALRLAKQVGEPEDRAQLLKDIGST